MELCWCQMEIRPQHDNPEQGLLSVTVLLYNLPWLPSQTVPMCTVLLKACCKYCTLTLEEAIELFCETYRVLLWLWRFYISICIQHAQDSLDISGTLLAWNRQRAPSQQALMNKNFKVSTSSGFAFSPDFATISAVLETRFSIPLLGNDKLTQSPHDCLPAGFLGQQERPTALGFLYLMTTAMGIIKLFIEVELKDVWICWYHRWIINSCCWNQKYICSNTSANSWLPTCCYWLVHCPW